jgi:putative transposase
VRCGIVVIFCTIETPNSPGRSAPSLRRRVEPLALPVRSPNLNAHSERWVRSVKEECLSTVLLIGERSLRLPLSEYVAHYHAERNHQGKDNVLLFPRDTQTRRGKPVQCRERLGGLLHYYHQSRVTWRKSLG